MRRLGLSFLALLWACGGSSDLPDGGAAADAVARDAEPGDLGRTDGSTTAPNYLTVLSTPEDYRRMEAPTTDLKYLLRVNGRPLKAPLVEPCYFQNTARYPYHIVFLQTFPELAQLSFNEYMDLVLRRPTRVWWGGGLTRLDPQTIGYALYAENGAVVGINEADVVEVDGLLKGCIPWATTALGFLPGDPFQQQFARTHAASLAGQGVRVILR